MTEIHEWALKYRALGWNVIPLYAYSKNPSRIRWKEYEERMATDQEFNTWFEDETVTGLGLITGKLSGIVVLDEDTYKEGGLRVKIKSGMLARTARGGNHHYFKYVEPIKSSGFRKGVNIEIKADGGFVVLPPTKVILDGVEGTYEWIDKCMPEDLMEIHEDQLTPYRGDSFGKSVVLSEVMGASEGDRHTNLRTFALAIFNRFNHKEWTIAEDMIRIEASKQEPPLPEKQMNQLIFDCKKFVQTHPKEEVDSEVSTGQIQPRSLMELAQQRKEDRKLEAIAPKTGWPELDRIIKGFVPGHIITLTGDTNVGKTTLACNFAEALRLQEKRTLYIALEPDNMVIEYLASVRTRKPFASIEDEDLDLEDDYIKVLLQQDIKSVKDLVQVLKNQNERFDLIVIDHIGYFVHGEQNWIQEQSNVIKSLAFLAKEQKSAVMMIAHLRKPSFQKKNQDWIPSQNDIAGSGAFKQDSTEVLIAYRPTKENGFGVEFQDLGQLLVTKTKAGPNGGLNILFSDRGAKIWSEEEAAGTVEGQKFLLDRQHRAYESGMQATAPWDDIPDS